MNPSETPKDDGKRKRGAGSFCIPMAVIDTLIANSANAYVICAYLVLARFTDPSGQFARASVSAIGQYTGGNKTATGPIHRALEILQKIRATRVEEISNRLPGNRHAMVKKVIDLGPIVVRRALWIEQGGEPLPDEKSPMDHVYYVLPDFGEELNERAWFGNNIVTGVGGFDKPLRTLKNAGDTAARLLLQMYGANDMMGWTGVRPIGERSGPWIHYHPVSEDIFVKGNYRLIRSKKQGPIASIPSGIAESTEDYWQALKALEAAGFAYESVMVFNRNAIIAKFGRTHQEYCSIPSDAEPLYDLDCRSQHGYKPTGEMGLAWATARTAGDMKHSVAIAGGIFDGTYAAFLPTGFGGMIAGIYRLRFRVSNIHNAWVKATWADIYQRNDEAFKRINHVRRANKLAELTPDENAAPLLQDEADGTHDAGPSNDD